MIIKNFTPHTLNIFNEDGSIKLSIPSDGVARAASSRTQVADVDGIPVNKTTFGEVVGLPAPAPDTIYVVSALTAQACKGIRSDVYITDDAVRDTEGRIVGCKALAQI